MGRYVPPEYEGVVSGNALQGKHALGSRARKVKDGILTVRFEMPFAIWCTTCTPEVIIGQGVRFNAEKKIVGKYYSSNIYSFRMKHVLCGGWIEIRTDPKNTAYVVTEGARKRDTGEDTVKPGDFEIITQDEREQRRNDAFAALEGKVQDKMEADANTRRIDELKRAQERDWEDPYTVSQKLRKTFRAERKIRASKAAATEALQDRFGLGIELLAETEEDAQRAKLIDFAAQNPSAGLRSATLKPLFSSERLPSTNLAATGTKSVCKPTHTAEMKRNALQNHLHSNTRAALDPFLKPGGTSGLVIPGIKRKRSDTDSKRTAEEAEVAEDSRIIAGTPALVDYDSD